METLPMASEGKEPREPFSIKHDPGPRAPMLWLLMCGLALMVAIAVGTMVSINQFKETAIQNGKEGLESGVLLLVRHFDQQLGDFSIPQKVIIAELESHGIASPDMFRGEMGTLAVHEQLRAKLDGWADVAGSNVFDSKGNLINSSRVWPVPEISIADRAYFVKLASEPNLELAVEVVPSRLSASQAIVFARRISGPHQEFLGVVTRAISPNQLESFFASTGLGNDATIALHHRNGALLARYPHAENLMGQNFKTGSALQKAFFEAPHLTGRLSSPIDGKDRLVSSRTLSTAPLVVVATKTIDSTLAAWRSQTKFFVGVASLSLVVIAITLYLMVHLMRSQHQAAQRRLSIEKQRLDTAINNMTQGLLLFDASGRLVVCNPKYIEMYGLSPEVVRPGCTLRDVIQHRSETGSFPGNVDQYCEDVLRNTDKSGTKVVETSDGRLMEITNEPIADGGWLVTHEDVTERIRTQERMAHLAYYDALTDLPNRALFREHVERKLANVLPGERFAILFIDVDEFKSVNDSLGHHVGDELLKSVASRLRLCAGPNDFVARLGGDEFAVVKVDLTDESQAVALVDNIHRAIRAPAKCLGHEVSADASIGIAIAPDHGSSLEELLKNADLAMYAVKASGRRTYRFFVPDMDARMKTRRALESDLRQALVQDGFEVHYQPIVDLTSSAVTGCEALLRWRHPTRGMVSPADFIPVAEETGLIIELGEWVLRQACADAVKWPDKIKLAVNVSPLQFKSGTLALKVAAVLAETGLSPNRLELEITEAVLIRDDEEALSVLHQLRQLGVRIALDDFGTGYSSLSYLRRFPFDKVKIDRSFVQDVAEAEGSSPIVEAVVHMAAAGLMTTTAEGVETEAQRDVLRKLGCNEMQGYLFSAAVPVERLANLLSSKDSSAA
jgi:diguanylate cyclase (GGDEF)-like protein/PAS domain S-box-containing protein